jgi:hypothetical protein
MLTSISVLQAMFEVIEEEELAALREQRHRLQQTRLQEERELRQLREQQERMTAEKVGGLYRTRSSNISLILM